MVGEHLGLLAKAADVQDLIICEIKSSKLAELAQAKKLDVETLTISGDHFTSVPEAITQSIVFFKSLK